MVEVSYDLLHTTFQILRQKQDNAKKRRTPLCKYRSPLSLALLPYDLCLTTVSSLQTPHGCCLAPPLPHLTSLSCITLLSLLRARCVGGCVCVCVCVGVSAADITRQRTWASSRRPDAQIHLPLSLSPSSCLCPFAYVCMYFLPVSA